MRFLMVCLGNICRSPLAEGILKHKIQRAGLDWRVGSAGTGSWHVGSLPDKRSIQVAQKYGIDITDQRGRQFKASDFVDFDHIFVMDKSNLRNVLSINPVQKEKVSLILNMSSPGYDKEVPDPYYDSDGFEEVFQMLDEACGAIVQQFSKEG